MWNLLNGLYRFFDRAPETQEQEDILVMSRRGFLKGLGATAVLPLIPFNRVWSFPTILPAEGYQSMALQLEKVRQFLPLLYQRNDVLYGLLAADEINNASIGPFMGISRLSTPRFRIPISGGDL